MYKFLVTSFLLIVSTITCFAQSGLSNINYDIINQKENTLTSIDCFTKSNDKIYGVYSTFKKNKSTFWVQEFDSDYKLLKEQQLAVSGHLGRVIMTQSDESNVYIVIEQMKAKQREFSLITVDTKSLKVVIEEILFSSTENKGIYFPFIEVKKSSQTTLILNKLNKGNIKKDEIKVECLVLDKQNHKKWAKTIVMPYKKSSQCTLKEIVIGDNGEVLISVKGKKESYLHYYDSKGELIAKKEITNIVDKMKNYVVKIKLNGLVVLAGVTNNAPKNNELSYTIFDKKNLEVVKYNNLQYPMERLLVNFTEKEQKQERKRQEKEYTLFTNNIIVRQVVESGGAVFIVSELYYKTSTGEGTTFLKELIINKLNEEYNLSWTKLISKDLSGSITAPVDGLGQPSYGNNIPFGASYTLKNNKKGFSVLFNDFKENKNIVEGKMVANDYKSGESCISLCKISSNGDIKKFMLDKSSSIKDYLLMHNSVKVLDSNTSVYRLDMLLKKEKKFLFISN